MSMFDFLRRIKKSVQKSETSKPDRSNTEHGVKKEKWMNSKLAKFQYLQDGVTKVKFKD